MKRAATNKDCGSFFFVYMSSETRSHPAFFQSPLTAKLTAKPVDNGGFPWMTVDIRLASGADGRHRWMAKDKECRRGDSTCGVRWGSPVPFLCLKYACFVC